MEEINDVNDQITQRLKKLEKLKDLGVPPYGSQFKVSGSIKQLISENCDLTREQLHERQIHAVIAALARVEDKILEKHFETCVTHAVRGKSAAERKEKLDEVIRLIERFRKTF